LGILLTALICLMMFATPVAAGIGRMRLWLLAQTITVSFLDFRFLAEHESADAQSNLGVTYPSENGVPNDYVEAFHWYSMVDEQENLSGQYNLGGIYDDGNIVSEDDAKSPAAITRILNRDSA